MNLDTAKDILRQLLAASENWVGSPNMKQIRNRLKTEKIDFSHSVFRTDPQAIDLVSRMLADNEMSRPTAQVALDHPFLQTGS